MEEGGKTSWLKWKYENEKIIIIGTHNFNLGITYLLPL